MPGWRDEYLVALQDAERNNPVNRDLVEACSHLADRVAALEAEKTVLQSSSTPAADPPTAPGTPSTKEKDAPDAAAAATSDAVIARLRLDLAEALRSNGQLQSRLKAAEDEVQRLKARTAADGKSLRTVTSERNTLVRKVRDRDEELRVKKKLVADVQDELAVLNLQLNIAEQKTAKVQAENKQLVDRWMKKMSQEAEAMNLANEPVLAKGQ